MTERAVLTGKVSKEGRVVIPAEVRHALGLSPGDRLRFVIDEQGARIVTARALAVALWANNQGGDAGDSAEELRSERDSDNARVDDRWTRIEADMDEDTSSEDEVVAELTAKLGLGS